MKVNTGASLAPVAIFARKKLSEVHSFRVRYTPGGVVFSADLLRS
jgi:hypothetical protein